MNAAPHFSPSYADARAKFVAAAGARALDVEAHELPHVRGNGGEALATDVALGGDVDAPGLLIVTSATHGVEGHCGSGCLVGLLADDGFWAAVAGAGVAVLLVHAVNPHGFSHGRRVNEDNVDLNRNFRDFSTPLPANPAYAEVHPLLVPATWPPPADNEARIADYVATRGERAFQAAVTGGQYAFPDGLFYGGVAPTWSNRMLRALLRRYAAKRRRLGWIDVHTGLGPRGHGEKIYAGPERAADLARTREWWGPEVTSYFDGSSSSARLGGIVTDALGDECPDVECTAIALEYGTLPLDEVLLALRADHWRHNHPDAPPERREELRRQTRDAFYVDADDWKERVYAQAREAALVAVRRLAEDVRTVNGE
jgi:predicted deacylase